MAEDGREYIARISYGKDSLKMLDVIITRGLPLDRVTTTDVWATDTVRAELPLVLEAKERIEEKLWQMYRINVEHLCARNPDGSKRTYEQMFYHIPVRRSKSVQVERERDGIRPGSILGFPDLWNPWCQAGLKRNARTPPAGNNYRIPTKHRIQLVPETQNSVGGEIKGFPLHTGVTWCQKLKVRPSESRVFLPQYPLGAENSRSIKLKLPFQMPLPRGAGKEISWNT
jgi:hypothetical protein